MSAQPGSDFFELNGECFTDREVAVTKARESIQRIAESIVSKQNAGRIAEIRYERFVAEAPPGAIVIEGRVQLETPGPVGGTPVTAGRMIQSVVRCARRALPDI